VLTLRGRFALLLGAALYAVAWGFGIDEGYTLAVGLVVVVVAAFFYVRVGAGPLRFVRRAGRGEHVEGADLPVRVEIVAENGLAPFGATLVDSLPGGEEQHVALKRRGDRLAGSYVLPGLPRGRYRLDAARLVVEDPFGLERVERRLDAGGAMVVYPRVFELDRLFSDGGALGGSGRRLLLSRSSGYDLHSVRDYVQGESLRRVDWKSTAKRGKLMVRELEDSPRDEACVVLDCEGDHDVGRAPDSSFEMQVRVAASILHRLGQAGHRSALVTTSSRMDKVGMSSLEGDWRVALDHLAGVRADGRRPLNSVLDDERAGLDAYRLYLVTSNLSPRLGDRLVAMQFGRIDLAVIWVDARTWARQQPVPGAPDGVALRLARAGVAVARLRRRDDVRAALAGRPDLPADAGQRKDRVLA
jgi:uncharacterized protein (DUF58 family)